METFLASISFNHLIFSIFILFIIILALLIYTLKLSKKIKSLQETIFSVQRDFDHKQTVVESIVSKITTGTPLATHPATQEQHITQKITQLLQQFSLKLNRKMYDSFKQEHAVWNEKFSILLTLLGKTEDDLKKVREHVFKDSWTSISELRQKSQLLFNDMKEDGIFYRMQSLLLISNLSAQQNQEVEAFRHTIAALKLYYESKPVLPLSHKITWKVGAALIKCTTYLDPNIQKEILRKFNITPKQILSLFQELDYADTHPELLQEIHIWVNHIVSI